MTTTYHIAHNGTHHYPETMNETLKLIQEELDTAYNTFPHEISIIISTDKIEAERRTGQWLS